MPSKDLDSERMLGLDHSESCSDDSSSEGIYDDDVAKMVHEVVAEGLGESPTSVPGSSPGVLETENLHQRAVRAASLYNGLFNGEHSGELVLGPGPHSVYTASIVFPQICRSSGNQLTYVAISMKMIFLAIVCFGVQMLLVTSLYKSIFYRTGQGSIPHMCTYGQDAGEATTGPLGITYARDKSNIETDYNMVVIRNTLAEVMRLVNVTNPAIGPVDYGTESATCRAACVIAFLVTIMSELQGMCAFAKFVWLSPTLHSRTERRAEQWIRYDTPEPEAKRLAALIGKRDIDCITFTMAGMPLRWKLLWAWPILILRLGITCALALVGFHFLVGTGGVVDMILNSVALFFVVELDMVCFNTFAQDMTRDIMDRLEPYRIVVQPEKIQAVLRRTIRNERVYSWWQLARRTISFSRTIFGVIGLQYLFFILYLHLHCVLEVAPFSRPMIQPAYFNSTSIGVFNWELFIGRWRSKNITARSHWLAGASNITLCAPNGNAAKILGCGMPTPWSTGQPAP